MSFTVNIHWETRPGSIADVLNRKLGRIATNDELITEVKRIYQEDTIKRASEGKLPHQRKR
jgi:hypothetical protein